MSRLPDSGPDPTHPPTEPSSIPSEAGPQNTSGLAVTALALGILGFCFAPSGLIAIILGIVALTQIANPARRLKGQGLAVAGLILGGTGMVVSVIAILIGILLPALGAARTTARKMQNNTQVRGIHQAMVIYAQGNANHFPGLDAEGDPVDLTVEGRFEILLEGDFFTGEYAINPIEVSNKVAWQPGMAVTTANYSYALPDISNPGGRRAVWRETLNTLAPVICDRNTGTLTAPSSIHTNEPNNWRGSLAWNDNHTKFETTHVVKTKYGAAANKDDDLFNAMGPDDALMIDTGQ